MLGQFSITEHCVNAANQTAAEKQYETESNGPWFNCTGTPSVYVNNTVFETSPSLALLDQTGATTLRAVYAPWTVVQTK